MRTTNLWPLAACVLLCGCPTKGGGSGSTFKLEFNPVSDVVVNTWGISNPPPNATPDATASPAPSSTPLPPVTITINGDGTANGDRGFISLSYSAGIDSLGCQALAEQAQQENRILEVEGVGSVVEAPIAYTPVCFYPGAASGGTSAGSAGTANGPAILDCPVNADGTTPVDCAPFPPICPPNADGSTAVDCSPYCPPPLPRYVVNADKLIGCSIGGPITPPPPIPSPLPLASAN